MYSYFSALFVFIAIVLLIFNIRKERPPEKRIDPNVEYRNREKKKALKAMSRLQRKKAEALNEGDVADLEWAGDTQIIIMEKTSTVYEWDGFDWINRHPRSHIVKKE